MSGRVLPGRPYPQGATWDGNGTNFALYSENAHKVELCIFDGVGAEHRITMRERTAFVWHAYLPGVGPGTRYGYRVHGPYAPEQGHRFNPACLLIDPYARVIDGKADPRALGPESLDTAWGTPRSVVCDASFDWRDDERPNVPWAETIVYELHLKGMTMTHPDVPKHLRGTYLGLASPPILDHLRSLGVTTVELLPIQESMAEPAVLKRGLTNYWGYATLGYFAPDQRFASQPGRQVEEMKEMVRDLHAAGFEVVLDVVYNHTCEGDDKGPTVSLRGVDNSVYYRLKADDRSRYEDFTGCGNTLDVRHPQTLKLIMDSLRYWATEMHVDGFRFDLASALGREAAAMDRMSTFFDIIFQDPILSRVKLIAEPWDLGAGGYQVGNFPVLWTEWNGRYRDTVRRFWRGDPGISDMGYRLTGSSDLYQDDGRHPSASINFITAHDGFTLRDLVSYEKKHNEANGEDDRDGNDDNASKSFGVEGESHDAAIIEARDRQMRNLLATLVFSQGVPMFTAGDEIGKTQKGNNNAYCQDNALSWLDWASFRDSSRFEDLFAFVQKIVLLRRAHPVFQRRSFLSGSRIAHAQHKDITWYKPDGAEMTDVDWNDRNRQAMGLMLNGDSVGHETDDGVPVEDDSFFLALNATEHTTRFQVPNIGKDSWIVLVDTATSRVPVKRAIASTGSIELIARSFALLRYPRPPAG